MSLLHHNQTVLDLTRELAARPRSGSCRTAVPVPVAGWHGSAQAFVVEELGESDVEGSGSKAREQ